MGKRLFKSLGQQLRYDILFVNEVSKSYFDPEKEITIIDFQYKSNPCQLVLNGNIKLKANSEEKVIESYNDLIRGLIDFAA